MEKDLTLKMTALLVGAYNGINKVEENALRRTGDDVISISEFHILECIGKNNDCTIGDVARQLAVTLPTVTVAVNKLEKKGCVIKNKNERDGRIVNISLTKFGRCLNSAHRYFHESMVRELCKELKPEEIDVLIDALDKLNTFLQKDNYHSGSSDVERHRKK